MPRARRLTAYGAASSALTIDTLSVSQILRKRGMTEEQALGVVEALREIDVSALATKADIISTRADIVACKTELELKISESKSDILKWMFGAMGFQTFIILGAVFAAIKSLTH